MWTLRSLVASGADPAEILACLGPGAFKFRPGPSMGPDSEFKLPTAGPPSAGALGRGPARPQMRFFLRAGLYSIMNFIYFRSKVDH